jgi:hypothetical protein
MHAEASIYRFEIVRGLCNAVFEAIDRATGKQVTVHQWTPEYAQREAATSSVRRP